MVLEIKTYRTTTFPQFQPSPTDTESLSWNSDSELVQNFASPLPDSPWRREWVESYAKSNELQELIHSSFVEASLNRPLIKNVDTRPTLGEIGDLVRAEHPELIIADDALESKGERIVDGTQIHKALGLTWWSMDCRTYCFEILRRSSNIEASSKLLGRSISGEIADIISLGYYPVKKPEDFDLVVYGDVSEDGNQKRFIPGHFGMYKDGKVISKDLLSFHVYKHNVEDSAAYSSHYMIFRHSAYPDPRNLPLPRRLGPVYFVDKDGVTTPVINQLFYPKIISLSFAASWLGIAGIRYLGRKIVNLTKSLHPTDTPSSAKDSDSKD